MAIQIQSVRQGPVGEAWRGGRKASFYPLANPRPISVIRRFIFAAQPKMSNRAEETLQNQSPPDDNNDDQTEEWETMARAWLCSFPEAKEVSMTDVEAWIDLNLSSLPEGIQSMPRSELCQRLISIQNLMRLPNQGKEVNQLDLPHARFQRTNQWIPVYSWHSRYHLMHHIKKCHLKILKRKERKKGVEKPDKDNSLNVHKNVVRKQSAALPSSSLCNLPQDSDLFLAKRKEAYHKYEILVELEKLLSPMFSKSSNVN
ncbi:Ribonucleoside-diphosphate reductase subunit beta [Quillaja saponaria]|uniref:Ribonucleoside-diphosphate reductase subunit beta n=1 Tax=Quillaja saponaria TaxID=32244 RepID=A0AAD7KTY3_QUISA|nr:Ribonucleoside-diphosphate reductase subunit beta [Quillaja saponaria]